MHKIIYTFFLIFILSLLTFAYLGVPSTPDELLYASMGVKLADPVIGADLPQYAFGQKVLPIMYGIFYSLGLEVAVAKLLIPLITIFAALTFFIILKTWLKPKVATLATILFLTSGKIIFYGASFLTEIPAIFFLLIITHTALKKKWYWAGFFAGILPLFRTPLFVIGPLIVILLLAKDYYKTKNKKPVIQTIISLAIAFILLNLIYGNFITVIQTMSNFTSALTEEDITTTCGKRGFFAENDWAYPFYYLFMLPDLFTIPGLIIVALMSRTLIKQAKRNNLLMLSISIIILYLLFFSISPCKITRYLMPILPFAMILTSQAVYNLNKKIKNKRIIILIIAVIILFNIMLNPYPKNLTSTAYNYYTATGVEVTSHTKCNDLFLENRQGNLTICEKGLINLKEQLRYYVAQPADSCVKIHETTCLR